MRMSYTRVETFKQCPYRFKLQYIDGRKTYFDGEASNPLVIGTALHRGIETDVETAIQEYYDTYPIITDKNVEEAIKLEYVINEARKLLPEGEHEVKVETNDYLGYLDLLVPVGDGQYDLYDFKYSNNIERYLESGQLHVYKWYFERANKDKTIRKMFFLFAPKVQIRIKKTETVNEFRRKLQDTLASKSCTLTEVIYNVKKVEEFQQKSIDCQIAQYYDRNPSKLCDWCDFQQYCESYGQNTTNIQNDLYGVDKMQLPKNERESFETITKRKIWLYGAPFSGKTYLANEFPDVLLLSTDGNYRYLPGGVPPHIDIVDMVTIEGRTPKRKFAWETFKDAIDELEKNRENTFKTIVVDLLEDTYESCRLYMYDKMGITHESDDPFRSWDKIRQEFLAVYKRLTNLDYENIILISHVDISKDVTKKSGDKITSISPNLGEKPAKKIAGMVDIVARCINDEGKYTISFKSNEYIFGGGRLSLKGVDDIPSSWTELCRLYDETNKALNSKARPEPRDTAPAPKPAVVEQVEVATEEPKGEVPEAPQTPVRRRRRKTEE